MIVAWKSPISGYVSIEGGVLDADNRPSCGSVNGIKWFIDKNSSNLASGVIDEGGSQSFSNGTGGGNLDTVAVNLNDMLYVIVDANTVPGDPDYCDTTTLDLTISVTNPPAPDQITCTTNLVGMACQQVDPYTVIISKTDNSPSASGNVVAPINVPIYLKLAGNMAYDNNVNYTSDRWDPPFHNLMGIHVDGVYYTPSAYTTFTNPPFEPSNPYVFTRTLGTYDLETVITKTTGGNLEFDTVASCIVACSYSVMNFFGQPDLLFQLSTLPFGASSPTPTPTGPTPTPTNTFTPTATFTPTNTPSPTFTATPTLPSLQEMVIPGWIGSPAQQGTVSGVVPITLADGVTLQSGMVDYWPVNDLTQVKVLATNVSGSGGATLASLDTTTLANGSYVIRLQGTDSNGYQRDSGILITVTGEYKPGRVRFTITDLTIPVAGLPITIARTYDSLERNEVGDFGNGWSLAIGNPKLEVNPAHDVTLTMPDGRRSTFYFTPGHYGGAFSFFMYPHYTPEAGVYGKLEAPDCLVVLSGGQYFCFLEEEYQPAEYTYTDPFGRKFLMDVDGTLKTITDLNNNVLTFTPDGITSSAGNINVPFLRDPQGRITQITDPENHAYGYTYDSSGDLVSASLPGVTNPLTYTYNNHYFLTANDPRGNTLIIDTYYPDGRLESETDALQNTFHYAYDLNTNTTTVTNPDTGTVVSKYDSYGMLLSQTDPLGNTTTLTYDADHNTLTQTDALSHTTSFTYDDNSHQTSITDPLDKTSYTTYNQYGGPLTKTNALGQTRTVTYDSLFRPVNISDSMGTLLGVTWDPHGSILTRTDANGKTITNTYDQYGNLLTQTDPLNHTTTYTYDMLGRVTSAKDAANNTTSFEYDALGRLTKVVEPLGKVTTYQYDANGNQTLMIDPKGGHTAYTYNTANQLIKVTLPDNVSEYNYTYDWRGNILTATDPAGHVTRYQYDSAGQLTKVTTAYGTTDAATMSYGYDNAGRITSFTDPLNHTTTFTYDNADHLIQITDPLIHHTNYTYDAVGHTLTTTDANNRTTQFAYDPRGRLTQTTYANGSLSQQSYDGNGNVLNFTDQANKTTTYAYDDAGQLLSVTDPLTHTTSYGYDSVGNLLSITDANNHQTGFAYDALDRPIQKTWADSSFETFGYDLNDNLITHRLADGNTNTYTYNALDQLTHINYFDGKVNQFTYTPNGLRQTAVDSRGTVQYAYDNRDRLTQITQPNGQTIGYTYNAASNRLTLDTAAGTTQYAYDNAGRLINVTDPSNGVTTFAYDNLGLRTQKVLPNNITVDYSYDSLNRLTNINQHNSTTTLASYAYTLDPVGNRLSVTEADGSSIYWTYDDAYRLLNETRKNNSNVVTAQTAFTYDVVGNRLMQNVNGSITNYTYNNLDQVLTAGSTHYQYDGRGNLTLVTNGSNVTTYGYNAANRLTNVTLPNSTNIAYTYDADGRRVKQTAGSQVTNYLWDEASPYGDVVLETNGSGTTLASYVLGDTELLLENRSGVVSYYLRDGQGSTRSLTNSVGNITDTYTYTAFGEIFSQTGLTNNNYLYTGQQFDSLTGLYSLRARYYNPTNGRFLSRDTYSYNIRNPVELNRYAYTANNPVNSVDPTGYQALFEYSQTVTKVGAGAETANIACGGDMCASEFQNVGGAVNNVVQALDADGNPTNEIVTVSNAFQQAVDTARANGQQITVLGRFKEGLSQFAQQVGGDYLQVDPYNWGRNVKYIADAIRNGNLIVTRPDINLAKVDTASIFYREIQLLSKLDYGFVDGILQKVK